MLATGLTYSDIRCRARRRSPRCDAYADERLIERARAIGVRMRERLLAVSMRHACIGDVRGDGAFLVVELVRDRHARTPLAPWPDTSPMLRELQREALARNVSFAVRGNLVLLAPPLPVTDAELDHALGRARRAHRRVRRTALQTGARTMTFKLTYSTMFDPPPDLHSRFDAALDTVRASLGGETHDAASAAWTSTPGSSSSCAQPADTRVLARPLPDRQRRARQRGHRRRAAAVPGLARRRVARARARCCARRRSGSRIASTRSARRSRSRSARTAWRRSARPRKRADLIDVLRRPDGGERRLRRKRWPTIRCQASSRATAAC